MVKRIIIPVAGSSQSAPVLDSRRNSFNITLNPPVSIPKQAQNINVYLRSLRCPYSFVNISSTNNKFIWSDNPANQTKYQFTFDNGIYSLDQINNILELNFQNAKNISGFTFDAQNFMSYQGDTATDKSYLLINSSGYFVNHALGTFQNLTGFTAGRLTPSGGTLTTGPTYFLSDNITNFQTTTSICVQSSLPTNFYYNNQSRTLLATIPITVGPNQIISYPTTQPEYEKLDCSSLNNMQLNNVSVRVLDQNLNDVDLNGKDWSVELSIEYEID